MSGRSIGTAAARLRDSAHGELETHMGAQPLVHVPKKLAVIGIDDAERDLGTSDLASDGQSENPAVLPLGIVADVLVAAREIEANGLTLASRQELAAPAGGDDELLGGVDGQAGEVVIRQV